MNSRRKMVITLGATVLGPFLARAQGDLQPLIGFLGARSAATDAHLLAAIMQGLSQAGYTVGGNARIEYRWAEGRYDRLAALAAELVQTKPAVIVAVGGSASAIAAKSATKNIPVVFSVGGDPVALGIVTSLARPGGNMTGMTMYSAALDAKRLELLRDIAPAAKVVAVIMNPGNPSADAERRQARTAAKALGMHLHLFSARTDADIDAAFRDIAVLRADVLAVSSDSFLIARRSRIVALALELRLPAVYAVQEFAEAGGLMSYGTNFVDMYRQVGVYAGRVLKGAAPASLPVQQPMRYELVINLKTAKALGIAVPPVVMARADRVIE